MATRSVHRVASASPGGAEPLSAASGGGHRPHRWLIALFTAVALLVFVFAAIALLGTGTSLGQDTSALASVNLPAVGGTLQSVTVTGPGGTQIPVDVRDGQIWPQTKIATNTPLTVVAVVKRPGWIGWLTGGTQRVTMTLRTPSAALQKTLLTLGPTAALRVSFNRPVVRVVSGQPGEFRGRDFASPASVVAIHRSGEAGTTEVAAVPRAWESLPAPTVVSWFPTGATASALVSPAPGSSITPQSTITVTFSQSYQSALHGQRPMLTPFTPGHWEVVNGHTLAFHPLFYGFPLGGSVGIQLPSNVALIGENAPGHPLWTVPPGSMLREQQILAQLGYLPLRFTPKVAPHHTGPAAQAEAAVNPPAGTFTWRYGNIPPDLYALWHPGTYTQMTKGALMAFENDQGLTADGIAGPAVWHLLLHAASTGKDRSTFGYTFVHVSEASESLVLWHSGQEILTTPVNTGIASAPTALGVFNVYEHLASTTMQGLNPDGTPYNDPGVPWVSYFNGGDALHGFPRATYGVPQSLGCVELPIGTAARVWPYTPIGTVVDIA